MARGISKRALEGHDSPNPSEHERIGTAWWRDDEKHMAAAMTATVKATLDDQQDLAEKDQRHLNAFRGKGSSLLSRLGVLMLPSLSGLALEGPRMSINIARAMCNTVVAGIGKSRTKVSYSTDGASRDTRDIARALERYDAGIKHQQKVYKILPRALRDATWHGMGIVYGWHNGKDLVTERVFPPEHIVDRHEGANWKPRNNYRLIPIDQDYLASIFPEQAEEIRNFRGSWGEDQYIWWRDGRQNHGIVNVVVGWHLPSGPNADDGRKVMALGPVLLGEVEQWKLERHPFSVMRWTENPDEWRGMGLIEEILGAQNELNRLLRRAQTSMYLLSNPYIIAEKQSGLAKGQVTNIPGSFLMHNSGTQPPKVFAPNVIAPEVFGHMDRIIAYMREVAGVGSNATHAELPARMESGRAQLVLKDTQSERHALSESDYVDLALDLSELHIAAAKDINYEIKTFNRMEGFERLKWSDIDLKRDAFVMRAEATSKLADELPGRLDQVERLAKMGLVPDQLAMFELVNEPDLEKYKTQVLGARRYIERIVEGMLYREDPFVVPDPALPPDLCIDVATRMYAEALYSGRVDKDRLSKLGNWIIAARGNRERQMAQAQKNAAPAGPLMPPPGGMVPPLPPPGGGTPPALPPGAAAIPGV